MATINMSKKQKISMTKEDGSAVKNFFIGVNWEQNRYAGEADIDFDINGMLTNGDRKVTYPGDLVIIIHMEMDLLIRGLIIPEIILLEMILRA